MGEKPKIQARLPPDKAEQVEEYQKRHDITRSEAVRRLVSVGLENADDDAGEREAFVPRLHRTIQTLLLVSVFALAWRTSILVSGGTLPSFIPWGNGWVLLGVVWIVGAVIYAIAQTIDPDRVAMVARWRA